MVKKLIKKNFEETLMDPMAFWERKTYEEVKKLLGENVAKMVGFNQRNPHHCYDLFTHILHTVAELPETAPLLLRVAAFFHDIGKPFVAMEKQGRLVFYGHAQKSAEIAMSILKKMYYTGIEIQEIIFYIAHHDDFISWVLPEEKRNHKFCIEITCENVSKHIEKNAGGYKEFCPNKQHWRNLLLLCCADGSAQADYVVQNGIIINTKQKKLQRLNDLKVCFENL